MGWQPDREPKGNPPKIIYLCDRKKECNKHTDCGQLCKHTADIMHAVNFISIENGDYVEERPTVEAIPVEWIMRYAFDGKRNHPSSITEMIAEWRGENAAAD